MTNDTLNKYSDMPISDIAANAKQDLTREMGNRINQAKQVAQNAAGTAKEYVKNNPLSAVAITLGIGLVVGFLVSRRD
ncbi:MAG: hypothetical protein PW734_10445 [Verrucomicrobium sp.]|nr:hypothetical protein [Verrucomicrobium sp.]